MVHAYIIGEVSYARTSSIAVLQPEMSRDTGSPSLSTPSQHGQCHSACPPAAATVTGGPTVPANLSDPSIDLSVTHISKSIPRVRMAEKACNSELLPPQLQY